MVAVTTWLFPVAGPVQRSTTGVVTGCEGRFSAPVRALTSASVPVSALIRGG